MARVRTEVDSGYDSDDGRVRAQLWRGRRDGKGHGKDTEVQVWEAGAARSLKDRAEASDLIFVHLGLLKPITS